MIIKVTDRNLHSKSISIINGNTYNVSENVIKEMNIQKYLTECVRDGDKQCPYSIVKYHGCLSTYVIS